jgi:hypothetical protein
VDRSAYFPVPKCDGAMVDFALRPASARPQLPMTDAQFLGMVRLCCPHDPEGMKLGAYNGRQYALHNSLEAKLALERRQGPTRSFSSALWHFGKTLRS